MKKALGYKNDYSGLDPGYKDVFLNVIPSSDMIYQIGEAKPCPKELEVPLVKCEVSEFRGFRSGKRSALI